MQAQFARLLSCEIASRMMWSNSKPKPRGALQRVFGSSPYIEPVASHLPSARFSASRLVVLENSARIAAFFEPPHGVFDRKPLNRSSHSNPFGYDFRSTFFAAGIVSA